MMYQVPGNESVYPQANQEVIDKDGLFSQSKNKASRIFRESDLLMSVLVDKDYTAIENHVDEITKQKITLGQYVNLAKLIPKDKIQEKRDPHMELVNRGGRAYYEPVYDRETSIINSFSKWEQAFRVYSSIYSETHPDRIKELIQYMHVIHTASLTYIWDNVYSYDMDFRLHMGKYPQRNWGIILNLAWQTRLKEKIFNYRSNSGRDNSNRDNHGNQQSCSTGKNCWKYNRGKCTYGFNYKFDHKCGICGKLGHGAINCSKGRNGSKQAADKETGEAKMLYDKK